MKSKIDKTLEIILALALIGLVFEGVYIYTHWSEPPELTEVEEAEAPQNEQLPAGVDLPDYFNLDIPFVCQAPLGNWEPPFDHACEEASILMVHYYLENKSVDSFEAAQDIRDIVEFEKRTYGFYKDTSAEETAQLIRDYFGYKAKVYFDISLEDIKRELVKGNPVVVPTAGRMLGNPYFTPPGPLLHMLVIKGYTPTEFIVNDAGTRRGADYTYSYAILEAAIHDWADNNVETGRRAMIVIQKITEKLNPGALPQVYISSDSLQQGDTLLIKVTADALTDEIRGRLGPIRINFFKPATLEKWIGIAGIDAKEKLGKHNLFIFAGGHKIEKELNIVERKFPISKLLVTKELAEKGYTPSKIIEDVITKDNVTFKEILKVYTPKAYFSAPFIYPLKKIKDVGAFGNIRKSENFTLQHLGVDLEAPVGTPVYAINDGVVCFSQDLTTYGKTLIIDHGLGIFSLYLHLDEFKVLKGERVEGGDIVAFSGETGYSIDPHLHFSVKIAGASVDPLRFIGIIKKEMIK